MNDDSEVLQQKLLKLLQDLIPDISAGDVEAIHSDLGSPLSDHSGASRFDPGANLSSPFSMQEASSFTSGLHGFRTFPDQREDLFQTGDIPAVQDRFYSLLKQKLQTEAERNPPLFPWETEIHDYESVWMSQLRNLKLPIAVPEEVLTQLLQKCQTVAQSTLREGTKLIRAVEELFPGQDQSLNYLAGLVMTAPARSPVAAVETDPSVSYESVDSPKQMVLSLLAAREILSSLSITLSTSQNRVERQWLSESGMLTLTAEYQSGDNPRLRVEGRLPDGGSLTLRGNQTQAIADRPTSGSLSVELFDPLPNQVYTLEVRLSPSSVEPLTYAVHIEG